jgi:hypothetical protein
VPFGGAGASEHDGSDIERVMEASRCVRDGRAREETVVARRAGRSVDKYIMVVIKLSNGRAMH